METTTVLEQERHMLSVAKTVAAELASAFVEFGQTHIRTPILYPDGSNALVRIDSAGMKYFVTDSGQGSRSAHMAGADRWFEKIALSQAKLAGISFNQEEFFCVEVTREQLPYAVATVANVSKSSVELALLKASEHRHIERSELVRDRVKQAFGKQASFDVALQGISNHDWRMDAVVKVDGRQVAFDVVKPVPQSIFPEIAKLVDLRESFPQLGFVSVLTGKVKEIEYLNMLSRNSKVIYSKDSHEVYKAAA